MKTKKIRRYFYHPEDDETVVTWINKQQNLSASIYVLIKNYVAKYGSTDVMKRVTILTDEMPSSETSGTYSDAETANNVMNEKTAEVDEVTEPVNVKEETQINNVYNDEISPANRGKTSQQINDELLAQLLK